MDEALILVELAKQVVNQSLLEWQHEPYRWANERDAQVDIANRLTSLLRLLGRDKFLANYPRAAAGFERSQWWSRVSCEPEIKYRDQDGILFSPKPDIVIWDDLPNADEPPAIPPILWVCEIKCRHGASSDDDVKKVRSLITRGLARYGCCINVQHVSAAEKESLRWSADSDEPRITICEARIPKPAASVAAGK